VQKGNLARTRVGGADDVERVSQANLAGKVVKALLRGLVNRVCLTKFKMAYAFHMYIHLFFGGVMPFISH
jgi:hypothetical protein